MSNQTIFRVSSMMLVVALLSLSAIRGAGAQDPPRPPEPKPAPQREDAKAKRPDKRQGAQADDQVVDKQSTIEIKTDLVELDVTVIDQNGLSIMDLKKEDFSVYEDKIKQTIENVSRQEVPVSFGMVI